MYVCFHPFTPSAGPSRNVSGPTTTSHQAHREAAIDIPQDEMDAWSDESASLEYGKDPVHMGVTDSPYMDDYMDLFGERASVRHFDSLARRVPQHSFGSMHSREKSIYAASDVPSTVHMLEEGYLAPEHGHLERDMHNSMHTSMRMGSSMASHMPEAAIPLQRVNKADETEEEMVVDDDEDSPYPEVCASVSNMDDPTMQILTFRSIFLATLIPVVVGAINLYFTLRYPAPTLSPLIVIVIAYPIGKIMAITLPTRVFQFPQWLGGFQFSLNPSPFNIKEHALIGIAASISIVPSFLFNFLVANDVKIESWQGQDEWFDFVFIMSSGVLGFAFAGLLYRLLVQPSSMLWPQALVLSTILNTLHAGEDIFDKRMTRMRWLVIIAVLAFLYNFFPNYIFYALQLFCWVTWIRPHDVTTNIVTGAKGMGMTSLSFDWNQIIYHGSPLVMPWWAECNFFFGFVLFAWFVMPILYFTNTWQSAYFPFSGANMYDKYGKLYQIQNVLDMPSMQFNRDRYEAYSPVYLPLGFLVSYFAGFAIITSMIVHTTVNHGQIIFQVWHRGKREQDDIHAKLMRNYPSIPSWWYSWLFIIPFLTIVIIIDYLKFDFHTSSLVVALLLAFIYLLPSGFIMALTGVQLGNNILCDVIGGYLLPGQPQAFMLFKGLSVQTLVSCLLFVGNMKLGHYMKIPPRITFWVQIVATVIVSCVQMAVKRVLFLTVPDMCTYHQKYSLTCISANLYYSSALMWSAIGPKYIFKDKAFQFMLWGLLAGFLAPTLLWIIRARFRVRWLYYVNFPVIFYSISFFPMSGSLNYTMWFLVGTIFQYYLRKYHFRWWSKYNFTTSNALDLGTVISQLVILLTILIPLGDRSMINWWGNTVVRSTADFNNVPLKEVPPGGIKPVVFG